jgi:hypothetical protein
MHVEKNMLNNIGNVMSSKSGILKSASKATIERTIGNRRSNIGRKFGFGINGSGDRMTITHAGTGENINNILVLGEMETGRCASNRNTMKMMKGARSFMANS